MSKLGVRRAVLSAWIALPLGLLSARALASESLEVNDGDTVYVDGTVRFKTVTVHAGGVLRIRSVASGGTGTLTLKAESIVVEKDGAIDASSSGYSGTSGDGGTPACCPAAAGMAGPSGMTAPGGGGGNGGKGAAGCPNGGPGGDAYASFDNAYPGAAGGASSFQMAMSGIPNAGGRGGGSVTLLAATVTINGEIRADGAPGVKYGGVGSGGGAGGIIRIDAHEVLGDGRLSARGGNGAEAYSGIGGGGGGGVIQITASKDLMNDLPGRDVGGGTTGTGTCQAADDGINEVNIDANKPCTDADGDGHGSTACMGDDCDDADPTVHGGDPAAVEVCDGQDNNCDGESDNNLVSDACPAGQSCQSGACTDDGTGGGGAAGGPSAPDYVDYRGACEVGTAGTLPSGNIAFLAAGWMALMAALRRRKKG